MGPSLTPTVENNDQYPQFAQMFPTLSRLQHILASGQFQVYVRDTDIEIFREDLKKFAEEGTAFRANQQYIFDNDLEHFAQVDAEISELQKELNARATANQEELERDVDVKELLELKKADRALMVKDYNLRKKIEDYDLVIHESSTEYLKLMLLSKENADRGIARDPALRQQMMQILFAMLPSHQAKEPLRAKLLAVREERTRLLEKMAQKKSLSKSKGKSTGIPDVR